ncbi:Choline dehydrogenase [Rhizobium sp. NFR07]|uniref:GMC oxidoreductase n=1 Tax=Rhizobium sp. NFR07 TaxID=1566262 RepID=UPI0008E385CB|nr:GMC oxidoreductase [Rhizobium sp. NFR07]SFB62996.1 Choline dehydrogenase [Rhizobium sp. NFR07]
MNVSQGRYSSYAFDVCVIGGGPVGLATALAIARGSKGRVLLLESGGTETDVEAQDLSRLVIPDETHHRPAALTVYRGLGGTSRWWGGRCVEYDDIDFETRDYVADSGWPIDHAEIKPFYSEAHAFLTSDFVAARPASILADHPANVESWARVQNVERSKRSALKSTPNLTIALHTTAISFELDTTTGVVLALNAKEKSRPQRFQAQYYVLACGGRENARLLLQLQAVSSTILNGEAATTGHYYMGHLTGAIASVQFRDRQLAQHVLFKRTANGTYMRGRFQLNATTQKSQQVLNTVMWPQNYEHLADGAHDGASAVYQLLRFRAQSESARRQDFSAAKAAGAILRHPGQAALTCHNLLKNRLLRYPHFFVPNPTNTYWLRYHAEHTPLYSSRVRLSNERDAFDAHRLEVDYRYCDDDYRSVVRSHMLLDRALRGATAGSLTFFGPPQELEAQVKAQAIDGYHQIGLTKMSTSRRNGTVDRNCKVHDLENLYVAGSSIFPTSSQANPTLPAVAFALRLASHLTHKLTTRIHVDI